MKKNEHNKLTITEAAKKNKQGVIQGIVSIVVNTALFVLKLWAGLVSGSVAMIADAWHTLSDSLSSLILIVGIKFSEKKPTQKHPFGFGRWKNISAMIIGFLLAVVAYEFLGNAIDKLDHRESAKFGTLAIVVTIVSILSKEGLAQYALHVFRKSHILSVKADAWHHRSDALSSIIVLIGIFLAPYFWWIDGVLGIVVSLILLWASIQIIRESITRLLGEDMPPQLIKDIQKSINEAFGNYNTHHFHLHNYGDHQELTFHILLNDNLTLAESHAIVEKIEQHIRDKFAIECTIHSEPVSDGVCN